MKPANLVTGPACSWLAIRTSGWVVALSWVWMASTAWGQSAVWQPQGATTGNIYYNGGNVGIGTSNPGALIDAYRADAVHSLFRVLNDANSGGSNNTFWIHSNQPYNTGSTPYTGAVLKVTSYLNTVANNQGDVLRVGAEYSDGSGATTYLAVKSASGNVGIGTTSPGVYKLAVEGTIGARDIIVTNLPWSDYVFHPGYRLRPLSEVHEFIQANHHLPDIPSEAEVREKGVSLGDMQAKLLAKVEELTLHMIQQERENKDLRERIAQLENHAAASTPATARR